MQTWLADNFELLLEWDPALAGVLLASPLFGALQAGASLPPLPLDTPPLQQWLFSRAELLSPGNAVLLYGISSSLSTLRLRLSDRPLLIVEPSLDIFLAYMARFPLLPFLVKGELMVACSPEKVLQRLARYGTLSLLRHPLASQWDGGWYERLEAHFQARGQQLAAVQQQNMPGMLLAQLDVADPLREVLLQLDPHQPVTPESLMAWLNGQPERRWQAVERLIATLDCFK